MGHAAYMRGSRAISAQFCRDRGCQGCAQCKPHGPKPTPRPPGWGDKARSRAEECARSIVATAERYGLNRPTVDALALAVRWTSGVGQATAEHAAKVALE